MARRVVITGMGVISPLGDAPAKVQETLVAGRSRPVEIEPSPDGDMPGGRGFRVPSFAAETYLGERNLRPLDRVSRLLASAAGLALADSGWSAERLRDTEVGLVVGTMFSSAHTTTNFDRRAQHDGPGYASPMDFANTVINAPAGQAAIWHNLRGINCTVAAGTASGLQAIAHAADLIRAGRSSALLAGGVDELCFASFHGFARAGLLSGPNDGNRALPLPFDTRRDGLVLGEGAALVMLEDATLAAERGARPLAEITGHGARFDPSQSKDEHGAVAAIAGALELALRDAGMIPAEVDCVSASANGSLRGDRHEAAALKEVFRDHRPGLAITAAKAQVGEALGASGAFQVLAIVEAMRTQVLPGVPQLEQFEELFLRGKVRARAREMDVDRAVVNAVGLDGHCCAVALAQCLV